MKSLNAKINVGLKHLLRISLEEHMDVPHPLFTFPLFSDKDEDLFISIITRISNGE